MTQTASPEPFQPKEPMETGTGTQKGPQGSWRSVFPRFLLLAATIFLLIGAFALVQVHPTDMPTKRDTTRAAAHTSGAATTNRTALAPDFTLTTLGGQVFHLSSQQGHIVVLYFMATGCAGCEPGSHDLAQTLLSTQRRGVEALAIDLNGTDRAVDMEQFLRSADIPAAAPIQWGIDTTGVIATAYDVQALETTVVIDSHGHLAYHSDGPISPEQLMHIVRTLA